VRPEVAEQIESMGAQFVYPRLRGVQDGAATGGYAAPSSPEFREKQLAKFRELAPEIDIVITTALIPGRRRRSCGWPTWSPAMKPGSVVVDLAAERGGNCDLTVPDEKIVSENGVAIIGYTDFPSRMAAQASTLYATNIRHMMTDLTPARTASSSTTWRMTSSAARRSRIRATITYPPPPPKVQAIAAAKPKEKVKELTPEEKRAKEVARLQEHRPAIRSACSWWVHAAVACRRLCAGELHESTSSSSCWPASSASR
jgi:NAD(P) transhydrogenase subunit alpha